MQFWNWCDSIGDTVLIMLIEFRKTQGIGFGGNSFLIQY